jgi:hypothetical protein
MAADADRQLESGCQLSARLFGGLQISVPIQCHKGKKPAGFCPVLIGSVMC